MPFLLRSSSIVRRDITTELLTANGVSLLVDDGPRVRAVNEVGAKVWHLLDGQRTVATISAVLAQEHDAPVDQVEGDVLAFLNQLCGWALAEVMG